MPDIRVVMPNGTTKSFREGTPQRVIRQARIDMIAEMKALGEYAGLDFDKIEKAHNVRPHRDRVVVTQNAASNGSLLDSIFDFIVPGRSNVAPPAVDTTSQSFQKNVPPPAAPPFSTEYRDGMLNEPHVRMSSSDDLRSYIKERETLAAKAYNDNPKNPSLGTMTVGYGHTGLDTSGNTVSNIGALFSTVPANRREVLANALLTQDLQKAESAVRRNVKGPITQNQFDALVDFAYNAGAGALANSPMVNAINSGNLKSAGGLFPTARITQAGQRSQGLINRRLDEQDMFTRGVYPKRR